MNQDANDIGGETRRNFIKKTTLAAAALTAGASLFKTPVYGQTQAPSTGRVIGANDRINVAFIGLGKQGEAHYSSQKENATDNNVALVAACDLSKTRVEQARAAIGADCKGYGDYRKLLESKDVDAVCIATHDIWHAPCAIDSLNAGKHVYVEKPMSRYLPEAFELYDTVKKTGKILQVGAQYCSEPKWRKAAELIQAGKIGAMVLGQDSYMRNNPKGEWNIPIPTWSTSDDLDWKTWMGSIHRSTCG